ncbi:MAG: putative selenium-dependent hydroxylase accessory protein YqeC [Spirochaetaceae bacterium]|jgi:hypothetical protein|nr:putative selenium-dependent hydroxylase accessory protein YqeC [Spirochaetaceae bacterium]
MPMGQIVSQVGQIVSQIDSYVNYLCRENPSIVSIIGCGGKTSLVQLLASRLPALCPEAGVFAGSTVHTPMITNVQTGMDFPYTQTDLNAALTRNGGRGIAVLECDGSRGLPLKGWASYEPVIPAETTLTIGILPVRTLGMAADAAFIHRLPLFLEQSGAKEGAKIEPEHLARLISHPDGMFAKAVGKRLLFFNQIENVDDFDRAFRISVFLTESFRLSVCAIIAGSVHQNTFRFL